MEKDFTKAPYIPGYDLFKEFLQISFKCNPANICLSKLTIGTLEKV